MKKGGKGWRGENDKQELASAPCKWVMKEEVWGSKCPECQCEYEENYETLHPVLMSMCVSKCLCACGYTWIRMCMSM